MMEPTLTKYIPKAAVSKILQLLDHDQLVVKIKNERKTKHGDYRALPNGCHEITINNNLNPYRFLLTLIHEIAHFEAYKEYGRSIKPHGREWKYVFQRLMLPFLNPEVFPINLLPILAEHFKNPKASSNTDARLTFALKQLDPPNGKFFVFELAIGQEFKLDNGRLFRRGNQRRKRFECIEINTGKLYLFNPNAEVEILDNSIPSKEGNSLK